MNQHEIKMLRAYVRRRIKLALLYRKEQNPNRKSETQKNGTHHQNKANPIKVTLR